MIAAPSGTKPPGIHETGLIAGITYRFMTRAFAGAFSRGSARFPGSGQREHVQRVLRSRALVGREAGNTERVERAARAHGDVLLAVDRVRRRVAGDLRAEVHVPQNGTGLRIEGPKVTVGVAAEQQAAGVTFTPEQRADVLMARKMYREAVESYQQGPSDSAVLANKIGIAYHQLGELNNAQRAYERAAKLDPKFIAPINNLGTIYYSKKNYRRAIGEYKRVLRISPDSASTMANMGSAYFARKQYEMASDCYQKALAMDPEVFESRGGSGTVVQDRTVGDRPTFFYYMAKNYAKAGRTEQALNYIRKALEEGFKERKKFEEEPEFAGLRDDPEFKQIMAMEPKVL